MAKRQNNEFAVPDLSQLEDPDASPSMSTGEDSRVALVLARHHDELMSLQGVVMVGEGQDQIGQPSIVVGVKERHQLKNVPNSVEGVSVVGWVVGEVDALGAR